MGRLFLTILIEKIPYEIQLWGVFQLFLAKWPNFESYQLWPQNGLGGC